MFEYTSTGVSTPKSIVTPRSVPRGIINETVRELELRSAGWRESAAIWSGDRDGRVRQVFYHHRLGKDRAGPLFLELPEQAKLSLYQRLANEKQVVLALLHTHPQSWVGLSEVDQQNQLSSRVGFWSIVLPHYGRCVWTPRDIGYHVRAERGWAQLGPDAVEQHFHISEE